MKNDPANEMLNDWNPETASLLASLRAHGFVIVGGSNGEDKVNAPTAFPSEQAFLDELLACDEAWLYVTREPGKIVPAVYSMYLVLGNEPGELVSDWGIPAHEGDAKALETVCQEHSDKWEGRKQPLIRAADKYPQLYQ